MNHPISVVQADLTYLPVDAIVNAANSSLLGGGGVDGAIHRRAGPQLLEECRQLGGCPTGEAKITAGYHLPAKYVIHTVGPVWQDGKHDEPALLAACYRNCMQLAESHAIRSMAFPCISTGIYGYPKLSAARIAVATVSDYLRRQGLNLQVTFCCFSASDAEIYRQILAEYPDQA
ncbi:O-acetyl-ADP-ribose deacetylase [Methylomonas sp. LL1]|uniref:O-acetyl-ADP-ribose deacetylase n=1 Tax=Methylomonas sp. LL1 TaxID=2785785 RepID=UPI0018C3F3EE|nr:O-acetyl-ADP-ribose deacetylase [Methylomonas sp. LL1]QPK65030.1 O-acetyl-ADP-ribose deacetylase [Methylomonas sp. LL1]